MKSLFIRVQTLPFSNLVTLEREGSCRKKTFCRKFFNDEVRWLSILPHHHKCQNRKIAVLPLKSKAARLPPSSIKDPKKRKLIKIELNIICCPNRLHSCARLYTVEHMVKEEKLQNILTVNFLWRWYIFFVLLQSYRFDRVGSKPVLLGRKWVLLGVGLCI
jgi:hypothetical protein